MTRLSKLEAEADERVQRERGRSERLEQELVKANGQLQEMQAVMQLAIDTDVDLASDDTAAREMARLEAENAGLREMMGIAGMEVEVDVEVDGNEEDLDQNDEDAAGVTNGGVDP